MKPSDTAEDWNNENAAIRIEACRIMLYLYSFISESENKSVKKRIKKWIAKHKAGETAIVDPGGRCKCRCDAGAVSDADRQSAAERLCVVQIPPPPFE